MLLTSLAAKNFCHVSAKQELRKLIQMIQLPGVEKLAA